MRLGHGLALSATLAIALTMTGTPGRAAMGGGTTDLAYTPLDPCVVASTGRQPFSPGAAWSIIVREGVDLSPQGGSPLGCGVPGDAMAVQIHVQARRARGFGRVYVWPPDRPRPDVALLSYVPRLSSQATAIVPLCSSNAACAGDLSVEVSGRSTQLTVRVLGYFRSPVSPLAGQACPADECVTGFDEEGGLVCAPCDAAESCPADCSGHGACESGECTCESGWVGSDCATPAPLDCQVGEFGAWSACSATCGSGTRTRSRPILQEPANGGQACPALTETEACNTEPCPVDCVLSEFGAWSACSASCGGGVRTRSRSILQPPAYGGSACGPLTQTEACNTPPCPVDCQVSDWSDWGPCSVSCGDGVQTRARSIVQPPSGGGMSCPVLLDTRTCNPGPCP